MKSFTYQLHDQQKLIVESTYYNTQKSTHVHVFLQSNYYCKRTVIIIVNANSFFIVNANSFFLFSACLILPLQNNAVALYTSQMK